MEKKTLVSAIDIFGLNQRVSSLLKNHTESKFQIKKSGLQSSFESFLAKIGSSLRNCVPRQVCMFLAWCDQSGKTSIHSVACPQIGAKYPDCNCPKRLAYGTVKSRISQLKSIFDSVGRSDPCDNPASSNEVQVYLKQIRVEQSVGHVQPQQAKPIFMKKLLLIAMYIDRHLNEKPLLPINRFILARDQALFKFLFFGGDRGNDAGLMLIQEISRLPQDAGLIIRHTFGKTFRVDKPNIFSLFRCPNQIICPVQGLELYIQESRKLGVTPQNGYLFRPTIQNKVLESPLSYEAIYQRLKFYLGILHIDEGETPHSFRSGCAITFRNLDQTNSSPQNIMQHIGWSTEWSANHYSRNAALQQSMVMSEAMSKSQQSFQMTNLSRQNNSFVDETKLSKAFL